MEHWLPLFEEKLATLFDHLSDGDLMVIGGGEIYALALPRADRLHLTFVDTLVEDADAHFPEWAPGDWVEVHRSAHPADARHAFAFEDVDFRRR